MLTAEQTRGPGGGLISALCGYGLLVALAVVLATQWVEAVQVGNAARQQTRLVARRGACLSLSPQAVNQPAPGFDLPDLAGKKRSLAALRGQTVLLHFWFTRCPPCIEELPSLERLHRTMGSRKDFELVTVSVDESRDQVKRFIGKHGLDALPVLLDPEKKVSTAFGTEKFPESYLIMPDGTVRYRFVNKRDWSRPEARACLLSVLNE